MKGKESSKVSGHFDEDIPRYLTEGIYTGIPVAIKFFQRRLKISMVSARKLTHQLKYFILYGLIASYFPRTCWSIYEILIVKHLS